MFVVYIFSNGDVGSEDYVDKCNLNLFDDYINRLELIDECIKRLEYEKNYLKERIIKNEFTTL